MANSIPGNANPNRLVGTNDMDVIRGFKGNDTLFGFGGNDTLEGGENNDEAFGGNGNDLVKGGLGNDRLLGQDGNDTLKGGGGKDTLNGGKGDDLINAGAGADRIFVSNGADTINGGTGDDWLDASSWSDGVYWNLFTFDQTDFNTGVQIRAGTMKLGAMGDSANWVEQTVTGGFENFKGSASRDFVTSAAEFGKVFLGKGADNFAARSVDVAFGGGGADRISITSGTVYGGQGNDVLSGGRNIGNEKAILYGNKGNDLLIVGGPTEARGGSGKDTIRVLDGNTNSLLFGGSGADVFEFNSSASGSGAMQDFTPGIDKIDISSYTLRANSTWADLVDDFEPGVGGIALRLDLPNFSNQTFTFIGLAFEDLSENDFILV